MTCCIAHCRAITKYSIRLHVASPGGTHTPCYLQVSSGLSAWTAHLLVLKLVLWLLGVPSAVPFLEALCYTGYPLVLVCINTVVVFFVGMRLVLSSFVYLALLAVTCKAHMLHLLCAGGWSFYAAWIYGSLCMATFIVRTMKRVLFREARQYSKYPAAVLFCSFKVLNDCASSELCTSASDTGSHACCVIAACDPAHICE